MARIPVNKGLFFKTLLHLLHSQGHYSHALRLLRTMKGRRQDSSNCSLEGSTLTPIQEQARVKCSIHYAHASRQLWCKGHFNIQVMSHLMIKHRLPMGQIFSCGAQTPRQEKLPRNRPPSSTPIYIFRLEKLVHEESKGFLCIVFVLLTFKFLYCRLPSV